MSSVQPLILYYASGTCASRPLWLLEELGVPYHIVRTDSGRLEQSSPEYKELHPLGRVPVLRHGELHMYESAAICMHLADAFSEKRLAPHPGTLERGLYEQWMFYAMTEIEAPLGLVSMHEYELPESERIDAVVPWASRRFTAAAEVWELVLAQRDHLLPSGFSAADVVAVCMLSWARRRRLLDGFVNLPRYVECCLSRPAAEAIFAHEAPC